MLNVARHSPYAEWVQWIDGDATRRGRPNASLRIMTGHVAWFFLTDEACSNALGAIHAALPPAGSLTIVAPWDVSNRRPHATTGVGRRRGPSVTFVVPAGLLESDG